MPLPGCAGSGPRRNGSKICSLRSSGTPGPSSSTAMVAPASSDQTRTQTRDPFLVCRAAFASRLSIIRSTLVMSMLAMQRSETTSTRCSRRASHRSTSSRTKRSRSVGNRRGSRIPRSSRSRSRRSVRSAFMPLVRSTSVRSRSARSSLSSSSSRRSSVLAAPRIAVSGSFRSCESVCSSVFFRRSSAISRSSACLRSVMSYMSPCMNRALPCASRTMDASSRIQIQRPSRSRIRYSARKGSPVSSDRSSSARTNGRSSGWVNVAIGPGCASHSCGVRPNRRSTCGLMYSQSPSSPYSPR